MEVGVKGVEELGVRMVSQGREDMSGYHGEIDRVMLAESLP